jgi:hypothetical protein
MINRKQYEDALYNALLFLPGKGDEKASASLGWARFIVTDRCYSIEGADNYVWLSSVCDSDENERLPEFYHREELKKELVRVRELTDEIVHNEMTPGEPPSETVGQIYRGYTTIWEGAWSAESWAEPGLPFAVNPNRLSKFSLLKPQDEYPMDIKWCEYRPTKEDQLKQILKWKMGPWTHGIFGILDRAQLEKVIRKDALW